MSFDSCNVLGPSFDKKTVSGKTYLVVPKQFKFFFTFSKILYSTNVQAMVQVLDLFMSYNSS